MDLAPHMSPDEDSDRASNSTSGADFEMNHLDNRDNGDLGGVKRTHSVEGGPSKINPKDPLRPRRKKARRACFACQRAHLTCGDERPCQRCIKRGLQDVCQDGVRKKAKYLDPPNEALKSGATGSHSHDQSEKQLSRPRTESAEPANHSDFGSQQQQSQGRAFEMDGRLQMPPPLQDMSQYSEQTSPNPFSAGGQSINSLSNLTGSIPQTTSGGNQLQPQFLGSTFDPADPAWASFDLASLNFGNHYGALEFGMLGHMSSGAAETPPGDAHVGMSTGGEFSMQFAQTPNGSSSYVYNQDGLLDWQGDRDSRHISGASQNGSIYHVPYGLTMGSGHTPYTSPSSTESPQQNVTGTGSYEESPLSSSFYPNMQQQQPQQPQPQQQPQQQQPQQQQTTQRPAQQTPSNRIILKPQSRRQPSSIYATVTQPHSYTTGFHSLTALLQRRFSPQKTLRIAKSLASIRPSIISCMKTLNKDDLVFMEKCFQRTLWEYEGFLNSCGTPTIICRRTGEVAAVGKEFSLLTGWRRSILLGQEPNLNINHGDTSGSGSSSARAGVNTPRTHASVPGPSKPHPAFLAELLDDESVIEFYEDFAKLAFGDSRGSVRRRCKLLKYRTKEMETQPINTDNSPGRGIDNLSKEGKVECSYCWTVKRDVFDIPMLIVMNFLPCI